MVDVENTRKYVWKKYMKTIQRYQAANKEHVAENTLAECLFSMCGAHHFIICVRAQNSEKQTNKLMYEIAFDAVIVFTLFLFLVAFLFPLILKTFNSDPLNATCLLTFQR